MSVYSRAVTLRGLGRSHQLVVELVPAGATVLDVGCAGGYLAAELLAHGAVAVDGLELDPDDAEAARAVCRTVFEGSIEDAGVAAVVPAAAYDAIVLADVLEHLRAPEAALLALVPKLRQGGRIVVSVPNVAHWSLRLSLLRGRFRYEDTGLLDRTHLRFFTHATLHELLDSVGLNVEREEIACRGLANPAALASVPAAGRWLATPGIALTRRLAGVVGYQFVIAAAPRRAESSDRSIDYPSRP